MSKEHQASQTEAGYFQFTKGGLDGIIQDFIRKHAIAHAELTEKQMAAAFRQAIECGDFMLNVQLTGNAQSVIYIPYMREQELASRIKRLEAVLKQYGIKDPDKHDAD